MRPVIAAFAFVAMSVASPAADSLERSPAHPASVTLLVQFEQPSNERMLAETRRELDSVMKDAGMTFDLRLFSELNPWQEFQDLVVVRVKGECRVDPRPVVTRERGALAFAHTSDGHVLPFMEVLCDRVRNAIRPAMTGDHLRRGDEVLGRAIARVIAHELYHILGKTCTHASTGIARHALSGNELVAERLAFTDKEIERISGSGL